MKSVLTYSAIILILLLTSINLKKYLSPERVLGTQIQYDGLEMFWKEFVDKYPSYIPGWIEIGRIDKVRAIDPNYLTP